MKKLTSMAGLILFMVLLANSSFSQFSIQAELRPRAEVRNGYKTLPTETSTPAFFVSQRTRLGMNYQTDKINTKISFYDVRVWGDEQFKTDVPNIGLYEAWAEFALCSHMSLKVGKQELLYDKRLIDNGAWNQNGTTHNAAVLKIKDGGLQIDFANAFNQKTENTFGTDYSGMTNTYKTLNFLYISNKFTENLKLSLLGIADGYQKENTTNTTYLRGTFGGIIEYAKEDKYAVRAKGFYQTGRLQNGQQVVAYYANAEFSYSMSSKFSLLLGLDYVSGTDALDTANKKSNSFNTLYGSSHSFNGNMEYFCSMLKDKKGPGLVDPYLNLIYKINDKWQARADFHYFMLQNNYVINTSAIDKKLGAEADLSCKYEFNKDATLSFGFSIMRPEKSMEPIVGGDSSFYGTWGFVMLTFKPTFFKS
jgi:hypothetical protein